MTKRVIGIAIAVILAAVGTVALVAYVRGAEERATAGEELVEVYVVDILVPAGTPGDELAEWVRVEEVPAKVQAIGSVNSLQALAGQVASVDLVPGEQLVERRFVRRTEFVNREAGVIVPEGKVEITLRLDPERAVGGLIAPGENVVVFGSFEPFDLQPDTVEIQGEEVAVPAAAAAAQTAKTPNTTGILLHDVLVTAIQESTDNGGGLGDEDEEENRLADAPRGDLLVTLAVDPGDAERVIFAAEFGLVYLGSEREDVSNDETPVQTRLSVYDSFDSPQ